jgi:hypothetical protein
MGSYSLHLLCWEAHVRKFLVFKYVYVFYALGFCLFGAMRNQAVLFLFFELTAQDSAHYLRFWFTMYFQAEGDQLA